jgi:UDP-glucose 4-epimerase
MKVFVTGGGGFIGSHVVDHLMSLGHSVVVVDNFFSGRDHWLGKSVHPEIAKVDILDRNGLATIFSSHNPEAVFHLAAHHYIPFCDKNPLAAYDLNVCGTLNVLNEASKFGVKRVFFASTADVYAPSPRSHMEDDAIGPFTVYGRTKLIGECICRGTIDWGWHTNLLIGRIFNAVGTRETNPHLVPEIIAQVSRGASELRLGNVFPTRDFVDLPTQARAIVDATFAVEGIETVNIGSGVAIRVGEMVDMILAEAGRHIDVVVDPAKVRAAERTNLCGTTNRLKRLIGYAPEPAGRQTIRKILDEAKLQVQAAAECAG